MKIRRKELRNNPTNAEDKLWRHLRNKQLFGLVFRRQHGIGPYVADFYHSRSRTVIEVDGEIHLSTEVRKADQHREEFLTEHGYKIVRFSNHEVLNDTGGVLKKILACVTSPK